MKKIISPAGALLFGSVAIAQGNKTDTTKKITPRKVMPGDVKPAPAKSTIDKDITIKFPPKKAVTNTGLGKQNATTIKLNEAKRGAKAKSDSVHVKFPGKKK